MRDPNRLDGIYEHIKELHKTRHPDRGIMDLIKSVVSSAESKNQDLFYVEDDKVNEIFDKYSDECGSDIGFRNASPERLDMPYQYLCSIHKSNFPDWRFFQFMINFMDDYGKTCVSFIDDGDYLYTAFNAFIKKVTHG